MNTLLKLFQGQTTFEQDVVFIFGVGAVAAAWLALYAGREPDGIPYGMRFFIPLWLLDAPRHWTCHRSPRWWAPSLLAVACAAWLLLGYLVQIVWPGAMGFKATTWHDWPMPFVIHRHRAAAIAFHVFQWFAGNIALSALSRALLPHSALAMVIARAMRETFAKIELNLRVTQTASDKVVAHFRAPITTNQIVQCKREIANAMGCGLKILSIIELKPGTVQIKCGVSEPLINNHGATASAPAANTEENFVYFITYKLGDCDVVKIGRSNEPKRVLRECRRFVPSANLVAALKYSETVSETKVHAMFQDERIEHQSGDDMSEVFAISPRITNYLNRLKKV